MAERRGEERARGRSGLSVAPASASRAEGWLVGAGNGGSLSPRVSLGSSAFFSGHESGKQLLIEVSFSLSAGLGPSPFIFM